MKLKANHPRPYADDLGFYRPEIARVVVEENGEGVALTGAGIDVAGVIANAGNRSALSDNPSFSSGAASDALF